MSSVQDKIDKFRISCYDMARKDAEELSASINEKINKDIEEEIKLYQEESNKKYETKLRKLEQNFNCQIFDEKNAVRHAVIDVENEVKNDLKNIVTEKIKKFVNTDEYKNFLIKNISQCISKLGCNNENELNIKVTVADYSKYKNDIEEKFHCKVETMPNTYIGGSVCVNENKNILINNSLKMLIEENL